MKTGPPRVLNLKHVTSVTKERKKAAAARAAAGSPPKKKRRTSTKPQQRAAEVADLHERAEVGNGNRKLTKGRWMVELTNHV